MVTKLYSTRCRSLMQLLPMLFHACRTVSFVPNPSPLLLCGVFSFLVVVVCLFFSLSLLPLLLLFFFFF